jgi:hypothetical protein
MRMILFVACLAVPLAAGESLPDRLRTDEARQLALTEEAARAADALAALLARYQANGVADAELQRQLASWSNEAAAVARGEKGSGITMPAVQAQLAAARQAGDPAKARGALLTASQAMEGVAERLGRISQAGQQAAGQLGEAVFGQLAARQDGLRTRALALAGESRDRPPAGLDADLKADIASLAGAQRMLGPAYEQAVAALPGELAQLAGAKPARAEALRVGLAAIAAAGLPAQFASAAGAVAEGRLTAAAGQQQAIAAALRQIAGKLDSALRQADAKASGVQLVTGFQQLVERQRQITATAGRFIAATPADAYAKLGAEQDEVRDILDAVNKQAGGVEAVTKALKAMGVAVDAAKARNRDRLKQATALALKFLELAPTEEVVVENPNAVVRDEQPQRVQDTFTADPRYAKRGRLTEFSNVAWQAELPPSEREALDQGARERYPERYAHDLSLYFEHLAGAGARARAQGGKP